MLIYCQICFELGEPGAQNNGVLGEGQAKNKEA